MNQSNESHQPPGNSVVAHLHCDRTGESWPVDQVELVLGRVEPADIVLPLSAVSRRHALVRRTPHGYTIVDLASSNGTFVNGTRIGGDPWPLRNGDEVVVGGVETLRIADPMATPLAPAIGRLVGVWIDPESGAGWVDSQLIDPPLSARQHELLQLLLDHEDEIVTREDVVATVWADAAAEGVSAEAIDALVKRLKARVRPLQVRDEYLEVVRGRGLRLRAPR